MSKAANMTALEELHALVADQLKSLVSEGDPRALATAIKFLKDNGIEPARDVDNSALRALSEAVSKIDMQNDPDADEAFLN